MEFLSKKYLADKPEKAMSELPEKVLQFGTGVLLRGLPDYLIDQANRQGVFNGRVVVVKSTSGGDIHAFERQDNLYTVCTRGIFGGTTVHKNEVCTAISRVLSAADEWAEILACAKNPDLEIVLSNTTEVGIQLVLEDIRQTPPASFPAKLLAFLLARFEAVSADADKGLVIVPTELIPENGKRLEAIVLELARHNGLEKPFFEWLENACIFCNSLVDRIVPGAPPAAQTDDFFKELGYRDDLLTIAEPYSFWAIEGNERVKKVLSFQKVMAEAVAIEPDITRFRERKLRLLNGTHTLACGLAQLAGFETVDKAMSDADFSKFVERLMLHEIAPAIPARLPAGDAENFGRQVLDRFRNPFIEHRWSSIAMQYGLKMKTRIVPLLLEHFRKNSAPPRGMALGMAAFLVFYREARPAVSDDSAAYFFEKWNAAPPENWLPEVLADAERWGADLSVLPGFSEAVLGWIGQILERGAGAAIKASASVGVTQSRPDTTSDTASKRILQIHPSDNAIVALTDLKKGETVQLNGQAWTLADDVAGKHKFAAAPLRAGDAVRMYGVLVGRAQTDIAAGGLLTTANLKHAAANFSVNGKHAARWTAPDVSNWQNRTFNGFHRADGRVGTANHWLVVPLVFCENRNVEVLREALLAELGYDRHNRYRHLARSLADAYRSGKTEEISFDFDEKTPAERLFPNVDGLKFLLHDGGCGCNRQDSDTLCGLLAGYITHPNTAGATILSLGCQNAQVKILEEEIRRRDPNFQKPLVILEQQQIGTEAQMLEAAIRKTLAGMAEANLAERRPAPLSKLCIGLECGGSDGFSGISANPVLGHLSDMLVAMGGSVILSEFPELCGVEQELCDRCTDRPTAERFSELMRGYHARAKADGSGFDMNPSPGNIRDGLITDAIKSAGAAKKGGNSPVVDVLDYPEMVTKAGLNLLCTPGNDVESTTGEVAAGATVVLFTTGLGTPTGNPIAPVVKVSSNSALARRMPDIIDFDAGGVITGEVSIEAAAENLLDFVVRVASGEAEVAAVRLGQNDFIPWKRGISL